MEWGLRSYGAGEAELGCEPTMESYLDNTLRWVKEVYRVLKPSGSFVLNIGDCFVRASGNKKDSEQTKRDNAGGPADGKYQKHNENFPRERLGGIYKIKQLLAVSHFAYCRIISETDFVCRGVHIWAKPNVPSPIRCRLKHSHEYLYWFVKDADEYYFDEKPWMKKIKESSNKRYENVTSDSPHCDNIGLSPTSCYRGGEGQEYLKNTETIEHSWRIVPIGGKQNGFEMEDGKPQSKHVAPFPTKLIEPYIRSLCPENGIVLDPFLGSGTTMWVVMENFRNAVGIELNENYVAYAKKRLNWLHRLDVEYADSLTPL